MMGAVMKKNTKTLDANLLRLNQTKKGEIIQDLTPMRRMEDFR